MDIQEAPIIVTPIADGFHVALIGGIHINNAWIERELDAVVAKKPRRVELDMARCDFVSSSGIGVLIGFYNRVAAAGGAIHVVKIQKNVYNAFRFARLEMLFKFENDAVIAPAK